jgi:hypothetical protein
MMQYSDEKFIVTKKFLIDIYYKVYLFYFHVTYLKLTMYPCLIGNGCMISFTHVTRK